MKRTLLAFALSCASFSFLSAQDAIISYVEGSDISVIRDKREMKMDDPIGFEVRSGDILQTGKKTFIELALSPKKAVIRMSENTTLEFKLPSGGSEVSLSVLYGRVRAKLAKLAGQDSFSMRNAGTVAGVRGTDFGMDVVVAKSSRESAASVVVYCFEGSVNVQAAPSVQAAVQRTMDLGPGRMVESVVNDGNVDLIDSSLSDEIQDFWDANSFKTAAALAVDDVKAPAAVESPAVEVETPQQNSAPVAASAETPAAAVDSAEQSPKTRIARISWSFDKKKLQLKNGILGASSLLVAGGAAAQIIGAYRYIHEGTQEDAGSYMIAGTVCTTTGLVVGLFGLLLNPDIPPKTR
jgi:hypothetical protein